MNPLLQCKPTILPTLIACVLGYFGVLPKALAVVPPPDGGYPNFTTAEGTKALFSLTTGAANTAVGWFSLNSVSTGSFNTGVGAGTLVLNTGDENTAVGTAALLLNTASGNTAMGSRALLNNATGGTLGNIQGLDFGPNVAVGQQALESNTMASANTAVGYQALQSFTTGPAGIEQIGLCTAVGFQALANASGEANANSGFGYQALMNNIEGPNNTAMGFRALTGNTTGGGNVAIGSYALEEHTEGDLNTAIGFRALGTNMTGSENTAVGVSAGSAISTASDVTCIGAGATGEDVSNTTWIANVFGVTTQSGTTAPVIVSNTGQLGTAASSERFKKDIATMEKASESILSFRPVTFHYKIDTTGTPQFGLIAEEVAKLNPALVLPDKEGKPYTVRYDAVNAMLLNEFLKDHRKVKEQQAMITELNTRVTQQQKESQATAAYQQKQIEALAVRLQKVSNQLELSKPAPQLTQNNQ
jgi:uncharacterized coiled-coil protein SlyX